MNKDLLNEAKQFYDNQIKSWMISDLEKGNNARANYLVALGCLTYSEIIGRFSPPLKDEKGSAKKKRFNRSVFRFESRDKLKVLDKFLQDETGKGLYENLRHGMAHRYSPSVCKVENGNVLFMPSVVARDGFEHKSDGNKVRSTPLWIDDDGRFVFATRNYTNELKNAVNKFYEKTFEENDKDYQNAAIEGIRLMKLNR